MRRSLIWSVSLHLLVLILAVLGLPRLWDSPPPADTPIIVEVVKIDEKTRAKDIPKPKPPKKKIVKTPPPPEPPRAKRAPLAPPPPPVVKPEPKVEKVPIIKPKPKPRPKPKAKRKPKPKPKAKPPPRQIVRARPRRRPPPSREDFLKSVLRDVAPEERGEKVKKPPKKIKLTPPPLKRTPVRQAPLDARATMSEIDAIRRQIEACWNIPAGARDAASLVVRIRVWVNPDGTVAQARIIDASRMASDAFFRAAAESALRAVLNPRCSPLRIPPKKYDQFKVLILHFNPKQATGS